jgi:hypothetical protein
MRRQLGILAAVPALVTIGLAAPAHATAPLENRAPYAGSNEFSDCGDNGHSTYWGDETILDTNPALAGQFFRFTDRYNFRDTLTNPDTGKYVVISGTGIFKELPPKTEDGQLFTYVAHDVGRVTISDSAGHVLVKQTGLVATSYLFDTGGDGAPGGNVLDEQIYRLSGPHPTFAGTFDFCGLVSSQVG